MPRPQPAIGVRLQLAWFVWQDPGVQHAIDQHELSGALCTVLVMMEGSIRVVVAIAVGDAQMGCCHGFLVDYLISVGLQIGTLCRCILERDFSRWILEKLDAIECAADGGGSSFLLRIAHEHCKNDCLVVVSLEILRLFWNHLLVGWDHFHGIYRSVCVMLG